MSQTFESGAGLGYASTLLQVHLGVCLARVVIRATANSNQAFRKQFEGAPWEAASKAVVAATGPAPLVAAYALIQACGAKSDLFTSVGLCVSTGAVLLGTFVAILEPLFAEKAPIANGATENVSIDHASPGRFPRSTRAVHGLNALGQALLIFGAVPGGVQLLCASTIVRLALAVLAFGAASNALAIGSSDGVWLAARMDAERVVGFAELVSGLALLDYISWGAGSVLAMPLQPIMYCTLAGFVQVSLMFVVRTSLNGAIDETNCSEFDFHFFMEPNSEGRIGSKLEAFRRAAVVTLYAALVAGVLRVIVGTYAVKASITGFSVQWGEPLAATACLLATMLLVIYVVEFLALRLGNNKAEVEANNGDHTIVAATPASRMGYMKEIIKPVNCLMLALLAVHMKLVGLSKDMVVEAATLSLGYGFMLAAAAVGLQVLMFMIFALWHFDTVPAPEPPFDGTGTLKWELQGAMACKATACIRQITIMLLEVGLLLGLLGMGVFQLLIVGLIVVPCSYFMVPRHARQHFHTLFGVIGGSAVGCIRVVTDQVDAYLTERRKAKEASIAQETAENVKKLEAECGTTMESKNGKSLDKSSKATAGKTSMPKQPNKAQMNSGSNKKKGGAKKNM